MVPGKNASSTAPDSSPSLSKRRDSSGAKSRAVRSRRKTSSARCLAVANSHADGFSGIPRTFQTSSARQKACCVTSSAKVRLRTPNNRVSAATRRPDSCRKKWSLMSMPLTRVRAPVGEHDVARLEAGGLDQFQADVWHRPGFAEQGSALAEQHRANDEAVFVDQRVLGQLRHDRAAAEDQQVLTRRILEGGDAIRIELVPNLAMVPGWLFEGLGEDQLGRVVEPVRHSQEGGIGLVGAVRTVGAHVFERMRPE